MSEEVVTLKRRNGEASPAKAEITRPSETGRVMRASGFFFGGLVLGAGSIVIPIAHFVLPWALPLAGIVGAVYTMQTTAKVDKLTATCPSCGKSIELPGGPVEDPMWRRCPECKEPLNIIVPPPPQPTA